MKFANKVLTVLLVCFLLVGMTTEVEATSNKIPMCDFGGDYDEVYSCEEITDSFGNYYSGNIVFFKAGEEGNADLILAGKYSSLNATMFLADDAHSDSKVNVAIFADGKEVFSVTDYTRRNKPVDISLDLTGVYKLQIYTEDYDKDTNVFFADGYFSCATKQSDHTPYENLTDRVCIDSKNCENYEFRADSYGNYRCNYYGFTQSAYIYFNLNSEFESFDCTIFTGYTDQDSVFTLDFYCDDVLVCSKSGISVTTKPLDVHLDVTGMDVLSIKSSYTGGSGDDVRVYVGSDRLIAHRHTPGEWGVDLAATCVEEGHRVQYCTKCGETANTEITPAVGHKADGKWTNLRVATCAVAGEEVQYCLVCKEVADTRDIEKLPHSADAEWETMVEVSCEKEGRQVRRCSICDEIAEEQILPATDHQFGDWSTASGSAWNPPVISERICSDCGKVETRESNATSWLKPLVTVLIVIVIGVAAVLGVTLRMNGLPIHPSSVRQLFRKETLTDADIEEILNKPDSSFEGQ